VLYNRHKLCLFSLQCLDNIKEYASDLQTFLGSKAIEEEVKKEEKYIMALSEDGRLQQLNRHILLLVFYYVVDIVFDIC
jgi:LPS O-antigen subunit length determinant protein (WzzB/FepE family)